MRVNKIFSLMDTDGDGRLRYPPLRQHSRLFTYDVPTPTQRTPALFSSVEFMEGTKTDPAILQGLALYEGLF